MTHARNLKDALAYTRGAFEELRAVYKEFEEPKPNIDKMMLKIHFVMTMMEWSIGVLDNEIRVSQ